LGKALVPPPVLVVFQKLKAIHKRHIEVQHDERGKLLSGSSSQLFQQLNGISGIGGNVQLTIKTQVLKNFTANKVANGVIIDK